LARSGGIQAEGLRKSYGPIKALCGVDLEVPEGSVVGLLGPNGAGKTTAVRILTTLLHPDGGRATIGGYDLLREGHAVRSVIGVTGQFAAVDGILTGRENLIMVARLRGIERRQAEQVSDRLLERFEIADAGDRLARTYSGGMNRRLDLAAGLIGRPRVLFLDEPTTGLDPSGRRGMWGVIRELRDEGATLLLTTQYLEEADELTDRIVVIDHGRVIAEGTANELKARVGGQLLELRVADPARLEDAAATLRELAPNGVELQGEDAHRLLTVAVGEDVALTAAAIRRLDEAGVALADFELRRPSLDEVFFSLTGHTAGDGSEEDEAA
jgi:daunorubicin resistance ABC transporter ATP-binding subunit